MESKILKNIEILAPVGGREQLIAAVRSGADAVYLGTKGFNARRNAENFDMDFGLSEAVAYCHGRGVKVHVTVNTLVMDSELSCAEETIRGIAKAGADAVIIQDLAVADMVRRVCPDIDMHASTQMAIHNVEGAKALEKMGFSRVVLARELTLEEIRKISEASRLEVECFVHGALCMSVSGLCELSAMIGGRSGNRGLCAQPCRLDFQCMGRGHALSLKDMSLIRDLPKLIEAGVRSIKIEGRMKRPEYVAAAVTACKAALNGENVDMDTLQAVFSRSGFTDGYLTGKRTLDMFGYRTKEDVTASQAVLKSLSGLYRAEKKSVAVDMTLRLKRNKPSVLTVSDGTNIISVSGAVPEDALTAPMTREAVEKSLGRSGGTPFYLKELSLELEDGVTVPLAELNRIRRAVLDELLFLREKTVEKKVFPYEMPELGEHTPKCPSLRLRFETVNQLFDMPEIEKIILPISEISAHKDIVKRFGNKLVGEIPSLAYPMTEEKLRYRLEELKNEGLTAVLAENLGAVNLGRRLGLSVHGGVSLNILNSNSLEIYRQMGVSDATVSIELSAGNIKKLKGNISRGVMAYGYLPLMKFRACPAQGKTGCGECRGISSMRDRKGETFTVICRRKQYSELLNCVPLYIGDKGINGADFYTLYFTIETKEQCRKVTDMFLKRGAPDFRRTGGLYYRELL